MNCNDPATIRASIQRHSPKLRTVVADDRLPCYRQLLQHSHHALAWQRRVDFDRRRSRVTSQTIVGARDSRQRPGIAVKVYAPGLVAPRPPLQPIAWNRHPLPLAMTHAKALLAIHALDGFLLRSRNDSHIAAATRISHFKRHVVHAARYHSIAPGGESWIRRAIQFIRSGSRLV
jgi:hypothetical protein